MSAHDFEVRQEEDLVASRSLLHVAAVSIAVGAIGVLAAGWLLSIRDGAVKPNFAGRDGPRAAPSAISSLEQTPIWGEPVGEERQAAQRHELESWGWVNRDAGVAHIPIERAMDLVVEESR
jgi:hypothetical protein